MVVQLATSTGDPLTYNAYVNAFLLWQLPHAVIAVSVITALLPAMSRAALENRLGDLRSQLDRGLRMAICLLVPAAVAYLVLGPADRGHGASGTSGPHLRKRGRSARCWRCSPADWWRSAPTSCQLRAFYALQDTRTPALINLAST